MSSSTSRMMRIVVSKLPLAEIGDLGRFPRLESLVAYAGLDPTVFSSGEFTASQAHMSKRGSPHLRRALWLAALSASRWNPDLDAYLQRRLAEGKPWAVAMDAVARKLLALVAVRIDALCRMSPWTPSPASCWPGSTRSSRRTAPMKFAETSLCT